MLDENLPTFYIRPSSADNPLSNTIFLTQNGSDPQAEYTLRRPDPSTPASKNCYAVALYDSYNPDVLYAEVLVHPEWTQPTLSQAEIRAQNGVPPAPVPIVPDNFTIQLYNPDQQVKIRQIAGSWNSSAYWEFEMPQNSFKMPSASALDRSQSDPAALDVTPKVAFKWKKDGKLSRDISCYLSGKTTDGRKSKEPDIPVAMYNSGKEQNNLTIYQPNMHRVDVEDAKGLEVVFLLSAAVIKDIFFNASRELFNISAPKPKASTNPLRKNSGPVIGGKAASPPVMSGAVFSQPPPASQAPPQQAYKPQQQQQMPPRQQTSGPPPANPRTQWEIDAETARLKAEFEAEQKEKERIERKEQKMIKKMLEEEEKEARRREAEVAKETERLRKQYGVPAAASPPNHVSFQQPALPPRQQSSHVRPHSNSVGQPQQFSQYQSAPHTQPVPYQRPVSTPLAPQQQQQGGQQQPATQGSWFGSNNPPQQSGPYLQAPGNNASASHSGFFGLGGGKKMQKKRSVFF
ncbi:hypothetical protein LARI1_G001405 [Lachnellula arida]|uniref:Uncharacterized protein n=1 Tax=Lachnellula arida TaxID=1316785 RepID=A0A8T9BSK0_9HELO|nr:hypothetical protein LARI1_G001405 [Lachnellula arida]